jgi:hypothetical protein
VSTRTLLNLGLAVIAIGLAVLIWYRPGLVRDTGPGAITAIDPQRVTSIELTRTGAEPLAFRRRDARWVIEGALVIPADDFQVHTVLALLEANGIRSYPAGTLDLKALGLDPPQASVRFDTTTVELGATEAIEGLRYVRLGTTVYLVDDRYQHLLNAGLGNFASRRLLPQDAQITALELPGLTLKQTDGVHWQLRPERPEAGADAIDRLLQRWQHTSALYVRRYEPGKYPDTVRVTLKGRTHPVVFSIIAREPDLVLARPEWGIQYHITGDVGAGLLALQEAPAEPVQE